MDNKGNLIVGEEVPFSSDDDEEDDNKMVIGHVVKIKVVIL